MIFIKKLERKRLNLRVTEAMYDALEKLSAKQGITISEQIRLFINKGLSIEATQSEIDDIRSHIRAELESYLKPQVDRIIKCVVKGGISSSASYYLNAKALAEFVPAHLQVEYENALMESKKLGIAHMQVRDRKVDEFMTESESKLEKKM